MATSIVIVVKAIMFTVIIAVVDSRISITILTSVVTNTISTIILSIVTIRDDIWCMCVLWKMQWSKQIDKLKYAWLVY